MCEKLKIASAIGVFVVLAFSGSISKSEDGSNSSATLKQENESKLNQFLMQGASQMNKGLPIMVDSETRLDSTAGGNNRFRYNFTMVNLSAQDVSTEIFTEEMRPLLINKVCTTKEMQVFIKSEVPVTYSYYGKEGRHVASITVRPSHCQSN